MWRYKQQPALDEQDAHGHRFVIAEELERGGYRYRSFANECDVYDEVSNRRERDRFLYEMVVQDSASAVYFDYEWEFADADKQDMKQRMTAEMYIDRVWACVSDFMEKHYGLQVDENSGNDWIILESHRPSKLSLHVVLPYKFPNYEARCEFQRHLKFEYDIAPKECDENGERNFESYTGCPDLAVYTKNRIFRMPLCCKRNKNNHLTYMKSFNYNDGQNELELDLAFPSSSYERFRAALLTGDVGLNHPPLPAPVFELPTPNKRRRVSSTGNKRHETESPGSARECAVYNALREAGDTTSRIRDWDGDNAYVQSFGEYVCPMGNRHISNNFYVRCNEGCIFMQCAFSTQNCKGVLQRIGTLPIGWEVPREMYTCLRPDGRPAVRPYAWPGATQGIVECTDMGGGKTFQMQRCVFREHTRRDIEWQGKCYKIETGKQATFLGDFPMDPDWDVVNRFVREVPFIGDKVLVILHRVTLCDSVMTDYLGNLGFQIYSSDTTDFEKATRLVICIDSLWKVQCEQWDLVVIDEIPEVLKQMCSLKMKKAASGKWNVWRKLRSIVRDAKRFLLMSAQADSLVKLFLDRCHVTAHWQQNSTPLLGDLTYEIVHHEDPEVGYQIIEQALQEDKKIVVPCAEQGDLQGAFARVCEQFPDKEFIRIDGSLGESEKREAVTKAKTQQFDGIFFTASMDCGVSIELPYDMVICRLNARSINACVAMQMCQRVRTLRDKKITFVCDNRVKDWNRYPGYDITSVAEAAPEGAIFIDVSSKKRLQQELIHLTDQTYYWTNRVGQLHRVTRRVPPPAITREETKRALLMPNMINEGMKSYNDTPETLRRLLDRAEHVRSAVEQAYGDDFELVDLLVEVTCAELNQSRNLLTDIIRIITLQKATIEHRYEDFKDGATPNKDAAKQHRADLQVDELEAIFESRDLHIDELRAISQTRTKTHEESLSLRKAYALYTFGEETSEPDDESGGALVLPIDRKHKAFMDVGNQVAFRRLCAMKNPQFETFNDYIEKQLVDSKQDFDPNLQEHNSALELGLCNLLTAFGFDGPFDTRAVDVTEHVRKLLTHKVADINVLKKGKRFMPSNGVMAAIKILRDEWHIFPKQSKTQRGKYCLEKTKTATLWPDPSWGAYTRYIDFCHAIRE